MSEEDDVWYCAYKCVGCNHTTNDDDPDCVKCKKTGCMMAFMINQDDEDEDEEECEVCCLTDCACVIVSAATPKGHTTKNCVTSVVNAMELIREVMVSSRNAATVNDSKYNY